MKHIVIKDNHTLEKKIQLHYRDTDSFVISTNTKDNIKDSKRLEDLFDFSSFNENQELFSDKNKKIVEQFKIKTPKKFRIDEFICLRSKMYAYKCGDDSKKILKSFCKSK